MSEIALIGRKLGMTREFFKSGQSVPVTVVKMQKGRVIQIISEDKNGGSNVEIKMTLTAPGCGMGDMIATEVKQKIEGVPGSHIVTVELVWDPPWDREMINEAARLQLGML